VEYNYRYCCIFGKASQDCLLADRGGDKATRKRNEDFIVHVGGKDKFYIYFSKIREHRTEKKTFHITEDSFFLSSVFLVRHL
jgi:hypothetical protein